MHYTQSVVSLALVLLHHDIPTSLLNVLSNKGKHVKCFLHQNVHLICPFQESMYLYSQIPFAIPCPIFTTDVDPVVNIDILLHCPLYHQFWHNRQVY